LLRIGLVLLWRTGSGNAYKKVLQAVVESQPDPLSLLGCIRIAAAIRLPEGTADAAPAVSRLRPTAALGLLLAALEQCCAPLPPGGRIAAPSKARVSKAPRTTAPCGTSAQGAGLPSDVASATARVVRDAAAAALSGDAAAALPPTTVARLVGVCGVGRDAVDAAAGASGLCARYVERLLDEREHAPAIDLAAAWALYAPPARGDAPPDPGSESGGAEGRLCVARLVRPGACVPPSARRPHTVSAHRAVVPGLGRAPPPGVRG
jgi:hypothetical protein